MAHAEPITSETLTVGSLFAGIGGFDLGLQRAGFRISWQVELDDYCRASTPRQRSTGPRLKALGNAVVPDLVEYIGRQIQAHHYAQQDE